MAKRRSGAASGPPPTKAVVQETTAATSRILSDFEYPLIVGSAAFHYWVDRCMAAAGLPGLSAQDALILHAVNHRARNKKLSDGCLVMHIEDPHVVSYALKKLIAYGLVEFEKTGRERHYATTVKGDELCRRYRAIRELVLVRDLAWLDDQQALIGSAAAFYAPRRRSEACRCRPSAMSRPIETRSTPIALAAAHGILMRSWQVPRSGRVRG
jgi:predicted MarR family transcription regulator